MTEQKSVPKIEADSVKARELRKQLWDLLEARGVKLTHDEHDEIKALIEQIAEVRARVMKSELIILKDALARNNRERRAKLIRG